MDGDRCKHVHVVDPPPGKFLRVCLDCLSMLIECSHCDAVTTAGPQHSDEGWTKTVCGHAGNWLTTYACPSCSQWRR